jgi:hypothetical protein
MRTALFISAISFYVQILKFGTLVYCLTEIVRNVKLSRLNLMYWIVGIGSHHYLTYRISLSRLLTLVEIGSAVFCPLFGAFKFIDTGSISLQQVCPQTFTQQDQSHCHCGRFWGVVLIWTI